MTSFTADPAVLAPGGLVVLDVAAMDPDCPDTCTTGCGLTIRADLTRWIADGGTFEATDNGVTGSPYVATAAWRAPAAEGTYTITVELSDSGTFICGGRQTTTAEVMVEVTLNPGNPPVIGSLTAHPQRILPGQVSTLLCPATDLDGDALTWEWTADFGTVTATTPGEATFSSSEPGVADVTCRVSDPGGFADVSTVRVAVTSALPGAILSDGLIAPHRVAVNPFGEVFVADREAGGIAVLSLASGELVQRLPFPGVTALAVDWQGDLLVGGDAGARVLTRGGSVLLTLAPGPPQGQLADVAVDAPRHLYGVLYRRAGRVTLHDESGAIVGAFGATGDDPDRFKSPSGLAFTPAGNVVVADSGHGLIKIFQPNGTLVNSFGGLGGGIGEFVHLDDVEVDADGRIYATDAFQDWVQVFAPDGSLLEVLGAYGNDQGELKTPTGLTAATDFGRLMVASTNSSRLQVYGLTAAPAEPPAATASLTPQALNFGSRPVGLASAPRSLTLSNDGAAPLGIHSVTADGDFSAVSQCDELLAPGASCTIRVVFTPSAVGPRQGLLKLSTSAAGEGPVATLAGTGILPANLAVSPSRLDFPDQPIGTTSPPRPLTLSNPGTAPLAVTSLGTTGPFSASHDCPRSLAGGGSCTVEVVFSPDAPGNTIPGTVEVVTATAVVPVQVALEGRGTGLLLEAAPGWIGFGDLPVGTASPPTEIRVTNIGTDFVYIDSLGLAGERPEQFYVEEDHCTGANLWAGQSCRVRVAFTPLTLGTQEARLAVVSSALDSPEMIPLTGVGLAAAAIPTLSEWGLLLLVLLLAFAGLGALSTRRIRA